MKPIQVLGFCLVIGLALSTATAQPVDVINYQGVLRDSSDNPLEGSYDMVFRFHNAESGGIGMFTIRYDSSYEDLIQEVMEQELRLNVDLDASNTTRETLTIRIKDELIR